MNDEAGLTGTEIYQGELEAGVSGDLPRESVADELEVRGVTG